MVWMFLLLIFFDKSIAEQTIQFSVAASSASMEVQCAQRVASNGISLLQKGQTFVVGAAGVSSSFFLPIPAALLTTFIRQNRIKAIMMKLTTEERKAEVKPAAS